jgi:hypothetical protein
MEILLVLALCIAAAVFFAAILFLKKSLTRQEVTYWKKRIMRRGEYELFCAAMTVTGQRKPHGQYPFYVFPQVSLGGNHRHRLVEQKQSR